MKAVLSATATSSVGTTLPSRVVDRRVAGSQRLRQRTDGQPGLRARRDPTVPARTRRRPERCGVPRPRQRPRRHPWRAPSRPRRAAPASGFASRISARRSVYFHSSTRRCGSPAASNRLNADSRAAAAPGSFPFAVANATLSAVSAAVLIGRISAFMTPSLPDTARNPALRARAPAPCRRYARCGRVESTCTTSGTM